MSVLRLSFVCSPPLYVRPHYSYILYYTLIGMIIEPIDFFTPQNFECSDFLYLQLEVSEKSAGEYRVLLRHALAPLMTSISKL